MIDITPIPKFTEIDFLKAIQNLLYQAIDITEKQYPQVQENGQIAYPVGDGGMKEVKDDIKSLERALAILKQQNS